MLTNACNYKFTLIFKKMRTANSTDKTATLTPGYYKGALPGEIVVIKCAS